MISIFSEWGTAFLRALAQLVFSDRRRSGILVAAGLFLISPWTGLGAVYGAAVGTAIGFFSPIYTRHEWRHGLSGFNPAIVGIFWSGFWADGTSNNLLLISLLAVCPLSDWALKPLLRRVHLPLLSLPAMVVIYAGSFLLAPSGGWFWTGSTVHLLGIAGLSAGLACLVLAMAIEADRPAGWALVLSLCLYLVLFFARQDGPGHAGLWALTVPLAAFSVMSCFRDGAVSGAVSGAAALLSATAIWFVWTGTGFGTLLPPLLSPMLLTVWSYTLIFRHLRKVALFQADFWELASLIRMANKADRPVVLIALSAAPGEWAFPDEARGEPSFLLGGFAAISQSELAHSGPHRRRFWEWATDIRNLTKTARSTRLHTVVAESERLGWLDAVIAHDPAALFAKAGTPEVINLTVFRDRVRCLDCRESVRWPPAGLWKHAELRCTRCNGILVPDCDIFDGRSPACMTAKLTAVLGRNPVVLLIGHPPAVPGGNALLERARRAGATLTHVHHRASHDPAFAGAGIVSGDPVGVLHLLGIVLKVARVLPGRTKTAYEHPKSLAADRIGERR